MLSIRRETDYALRCVHHLASRGGSLAAVGDISRRMRIPRSFLAKIVQKLSRAGIIRSFVGTKGGFTLARSPDRISFFDVIVAMEGPVALNRCTVEKRSCARSGFCAVHPVIASVRAELERLLKRRTFAGLRRQRIRGQVTAG
jgi:Rrf2 family protein